MEKILAGRHRRIFAAAAMVLAGHLSATGISQTRDKYAAISGRVLDSKTASPLANATVRLRTAAGEETPFSCLTDELGRYVFPLIDRRGPFVVEAEHPRYGTGWHGYEGTSTGIPLTFLQQLSTPPGTWWSNIDVMLSRWSEISGTVAVDGEPVENMPVLAFRAAPGAPPARTVLSARTVTDSRGNYRLGRLKPGRYWVIALPGAGASRPRSSTPAGSLKWEVEYGVPLGADVTLAATLYPSSTRIEDAPTVDVSTGDSRTGVDIQMQTAPAATLRVRVAATAGIRQGAVLRLIGSELEQFGVAADIRHGSVDSSGNAEFFRVPSGSYHIIAAPGMVAFTEGEVLPVASQSAAGVQMSGAGNVPGSDGLIANSLSLSGDIFVDARHELRPGGADEIELHDSGLMLSGRVVLEPGTEWPKLRTGLLLRAEQVEGNNVGLVASAQAVADGPEAGRFQFRALPPGLYQISAIPLRVVDTAGSRTIRLVSSASGIEVRLSSKSSEVLGTVDASDASLAAGLLAVAFPSSLADQLTLGSLGSNLKAVRIDSSGRFRLTGMPPGSYSVAAVPVKSVADGLTAAVMQSLSSHASPVVVGVGTRTELRLRWGRE